MKNKNGAPRGGNYVLYDIYLIQLSGEDRVSFFHLAGKENVTDICEYSLNVELLGSVCASSLTCLEQIHHTKTLLSIHLHPLTNQAHSLRVDGGFV